MTNESIYGRLNDVFRDVFDDESITVIDITTANDIEDWDSLMHINLLLAVETEFSMKFNLSEVSEMQNVGDMVKLIAERGS